MPKKGKTMIDIQKIKDQTRGSWLSIFESLGIDVPENGKHGTCPIENSGTDRFRCDNKDGSGSFFCNNCGSGDGISLVRQCLGLSFLDTIKKISSIAGIADNSVDRSTYDPKPPLNQLWQASKPLQGGDPVSKYLHSRGIMLTPENVRFCPECWESDTKQKYQAMVARFSDKDGKPISLHRTYLKDGKKAAIKAPRKLMKGTSPLSGGAIRLFPPKAGTVGIAEGIETAISATQITGIPCWSAVSSTILKAFIPPADVKRVVIFGDSDPNFCGQQAAYFLANRLYNLDLIAEVEFSDKGKDWNDGLQNQG